MELYDTHCHLDEDIFDPDREEAIQRMAESGVRRALVVGYDMETSLRAAACAERFPALRAAVGIHPRWSAAREAGDIDRLAELLHRREVRAIGEIGLELGRADDPPLENQSRMCEDQLILAADLNKPVCLHIIRAHENMLSLLKRFGGRVKGVCHGFSGSWELAQAYLKLGLYIGIGGVVTWPTSKKAVRCAEMIPADRLLLETDSPWQTLSPHQGGRNEPAYLPLILRRVAEIRGEDIERLAEQTTANAIALFGE
ncbi:MAG: TatD family hydrolase [Clostridia bacterium]|nr:TatD family hydrolase [Clostridia bacterium]